MMTIRKYDEKSEKCTVLIETVDGDADAMQCSRVENEGDYVYLYRLTGEIIGYPVEMLYAVHIFYERED